MANFAQPVTISMSAPVLMIDEGASLSEAESAMRTKGISSMLATDSEGRCSGVISSTDLIRAGLRNAGSRGSQALFGAPNKKVQEVMTPGVISVPESASLADAAKSMLESRVHRVFVLGGEDILGVVSTRDIMAAVEEARVNKPVSEFMSSPVFTVRANETIALATERLQKAHITGLVVVDDSGWPVGTFGQEEALDASSWERNRTVEEAMNSAVLTLPHTSILHNVARQALALEARRIIVMNQYEVIGVLSGIDFARAIA